MFEPDSRPQAGEGDGLTWRGWQSGDLERARLASNSSLNYLSFFRVCFLVEFREVSDEEWNITRLLPPKFRVGRPRADDRMVLK